MELGPNAQLAYDTILKKPTKGIPTWMVNMMEHRMIDRFVGVPEGTYKEKPDETYLQLQKNIGACLIDQYIPRNPLSMEAKGYEEKEKGATTGAEEIELDGIAIDSPEAVVAHLEKHDFPRLQEWIDGFNENDHVNGILEKERKTQELFGSDILKTGYGFIGFPHLSYGKYGYVNYFMAYALFPDVMERHFSLQADLHELRNKGAVRAYKEGNLPNMYRLDHDMADSRGTLVDINSLDKIWFPHFERSIRPLVDAGINLMWHCDGNLMEMVPRLIECGVNGFQGFQYEDGMDYEKICQMKSREGESLFIKAGVSVTTTLPHGTPEDVKKELKFLVDNGPEVGLTLGCSSSAAPGIPYENFQALFEGFEYYRENGRE